MVQLHRDTAVVQAAPTHKEAERKQHSARQTPGIRSRMPSGGGVLAVKSVEDGILGSWNLGTVIGCDDLFFQVKYDHVLSDHGSDNLVEFVSVSPIGYGVTPANEKAIPPRKNKESSVSPHDFSLIPPPVVDETGILSSTKSDLPALANSKPRRERPPTKKKKIKGKTLCLHSLALPVSCTPSILALISFLIYDET
ncbi:hypothetical protein HAX54_050527 [Datura stramonium]|uniref:Agenet-like domain-containing protein n=1 Tax=Datura stramonium TaxID=4076 RepID=A0ABS8WNS9_DATST|nr:hypothetical protein [Datura stramonium]